MRNQTNYQIKKIINTGQFIHPLSVIQSLMLSLNSPCNCGKRSGQTQYISEQLNNSIRGLQQQIRSIRSQVLEVQKLLRVRQSLQKELDLLREQRQKIQSEIQSVSVVQNAGNGKYSGYREMNQRLRRRINQVREFVQKMEYQNHKIQGGIISNNQFIHQRQEELYFRKKLQPVYQEKRLNMTTFQSMIGKLHDRQEQAWRRVRRQQQDIERHNVQSRSRKGNNFTYYSPKARTYYSPT